MTASVSLSQLLGQLRDLQYEFAMKAIADPHFSVEMYQEADDALRTLLHGLRNLRKQDRYPAGIYTCIRDVVWAVSDNDALAFRKAVERYRRIMEEAGLTSLLPLPRKTK